MANAGSGERMWSWPKPEATPAPFRHREDRRSCRHSILVAKQEDLIAPIARVVAITCLLVLRAEWARPSGDLPARDAGDTARACPCAHRHRIRPRTLAGPSSSGPVSAPVTAG